MLLANKGVQEELKLTDTQKEKIKSVLEDVNGKYKDDLKSAFENKDTEKQAKLRKERAADIHKGLDGVLKPEQEKRLHQVEIQAGVQMVGPGALRAQRVEKALKLSDQQKEQVKAESEALMKEGDELRKDAGKDKDKRKEVREKMQTKTKEAFEKISADLYSGAEEDLEGTDGGEVRLQAGIRPAAPVSHGSRKYALSRVARILRRLRLSVGHPRSLTLSRKRRKNPCHPWFVFPQVLPVRLSRQPWRHLRHQRRRRSSSRRRSGHNRGRSGRASGRPLVLPGRQAHATGPAEAPDVPAALRSFGRALAASPPLSAGLADYPVATASGYTSSGARRAP